MSVKFDKYAYSCARVRALERNILGREQLERLASSVDSSEALKRLHEFGLIAEDVQSVSEAERMFSDEFSARLEDVLEMLPDEDSLRLFRFQTDGHNMKTAIKSLPMGFDPEPVLENGGTVSKEEFMTLFRNGDYSVFPSHLAEVATESAAHLAATNDARGADVMIDKAVFADMSEYAAKSDSGFLKKYVAVLIDNINFKTALRLRRSGLGEEIMRESFLPGGGTSSDVFCGMLSGSVEDAALRAAGSPIAQLVSESAKEIIRSGSMRLIEKFCEQRVYDLISETKLDNLTLNVPAAYLAWSRENLNRVRLILKNVEGGIPLKDIYERI